MPTGGKVKLLFFKSTGYTGYMGVGTTVALGALRLLRFALFEFAVSISQIINIDRSTSNLENVKDVHHWGGRGALNKKIVRIRRYR